MSNLFLWRINLEGLISTKFQKKEKQQKNGGEEINQEIIKGIFPELEDPGSNLKGLSKCAGQSMKKDPYYWEI